MNATPDDSPQSPDDKTSNELQDEPVSQPLQRREKRTVSIKPFLLLLATIAVTILSVGQILIVSSVNDTQSQIESLDDQMTDLGGTLYDLSQTVEGIAQDAEAAAANNAAGGATPAPATQTGNLPRFSSGAADQAIGMQLMAVEGPEAYSESTVVIDPADGTKRVWMVWAHWCPYCQQELPELNNWWPEAKDSFPGAELVTVTTSMDPSRGNPLEPYLEESQFGFPVIVDTDTKIAAQVGVNAFPFWLLTDGDGTVLFRTAGALPIEQVEQLFRQLLEFEA